MKIVFKDEKGAEIPLERLTQMDDMNFTSILGTIKGVIDQSFLYGVREQYRKKVVVLIDALEHYSYEELMKFKPLFEEGIFDHLYNNLLHTFNRQSFPTLPESSSLNFLSFQEFQKVHKLPEVTMQVNIGEIENRDIVDKLLEDEEYMHKLHVIRDLKDNLRIFYNILDTLVGGHGEGYDDCEEKLRNILGENYKGNMRRRKSSKVREVVASLRKNIIPVVQLHESYYYKKAYQNYITEEFAKLLYDLNKDKIFEFELSKRKARI